MEKVVKMMARIVSAVTFPLLIPTYAVAMVFIFSYMNFFDTRILFIVNSVTFAATFLLPATIIYLLYRLGKISDPLLNDRRERTVPLILAVISYICISFYFSRVHAPSWMSDFMLGAAAALVIACPVNLFWKISGHCMGMGGLTALAFFLADNNMLLSGGYLLPLLVFVISGLVATSRLILERHTLPQVIAGFLLGSVSVYISLIL